MVFVLYLGDWFGVVIFFGRIAVIFWVIFGFVLEEVLVELGFNWVLFIKYLLCLCLLVLMFFNGGGGI